MTEYKHIGEKDVSQRVGPVHNHSKELIDTLKDPMEAIKELSDADLDELWRVAEAISMAVTFELARRGME